MHYCPPPSYALHRLCPLAVRPRAGRALPLWLLVLRKIQRCRGAIWHVPLAESAEAAQRVLQPPRAAGAARRQAPGAAAAVRRAALAAPSAPGGRNRPCRTPDRAISKKFRQSSDRGAEFSARERMQARFDRLSGPCSNRPRFPPARDVHVMMRFIL